MRNKIYIVQICLLAGWGLQGCAGFLEEYSLNEMRAGSAADLQQLMIGEAYPIDKNFVRYLELMTDDVESSFPTGLTGAIINLKRGAGAFTWQFEMFETMERENVATDSYALYYERIKACNVVLDEVDKVSGTLQEKAAVKGEALALRAYYYFMLVNLFSPAYNAPGIDRETTPGVPLLVTALVKDRFPVRESMAAVYRLIEADLLEASELLAAHGNNTSKFRASDLFAYTLLSRMYLYQERWEESAAYASKVIGKSPGLQNLAALPALSLETKPSAATAIYDLGEEIIWSFSTFMELFNFSFGTEGNYSDGYLTAPAYRVSAGLKELYDYDLYDGQNKKDLRPYYYYAHYHLPVTGRYDLWFASKTSYNNEPGGKGMRVSELYLNRAEASAQMFISTGRDELRTAALEDLNYLRRHRYDTKNTAYVPVSITDAGQLLEFCRDERRRELCFEEHRWFDLKRYGMPEIRHLYQADENQMPVEFVLTQGDKRYVLPIPYGALEKNPALTPNL